MHVYVCSSFFWNSSFCVERLFKMSFLAKRFPKLNKLKNDSSYVHEKEE